MSGLETSLPANSRICDRLPDQEADKAAFMQGLCDDLAASLRAAGAKGGEIEDVVWLKAGDDGVLEGAIVVARPCDGGFERMNADRCREILAEKIAAERAAREEAEAEGRLV